jgi:hypothetical protein
LTHNIFDVASRRRTTACNNGVRLQHATARSAGAISAAGAVLKKTFSLRIKSDVDRPRDLPYSPAHTHQTTRGHEQTHGMEAAYEFAPHASSSLPFPPGQSVVQTDFETLTPDESFPSHVAGSAQ